MKIDYPATIIKVRATLNLSQVELAEMLDVSFASVNRWENGKYEPTRLVKEKIRLICKQHNMEMEAKECCKRIDSRKRLSEKTASCSFKV